MNKIAVLNSKIEADILSEFLKRNSIPHIIRSYYDSAYDGIFQLQMGWGHVESDSKYKEIIINFLNEIRLKNENPT